MQELDELVQILWDYNHMHHQLKPADAIIVLGSYDTTVAERGAELYLQELAPLIVFTGGSGRFTKKLFTKPEAEVFADVALAKGVPFSSILTEGKSTNTGENAVFTKELLKSKNIIIQSAIIVTKPYMERRAYATFKKQWPELDVTITSSQVSFDEYLETTGIPKDKVINSIVSDTQRIKLYPERGFQIYQEIPTEVWEAWEELVKMGYTNHLIS
jgi:uncharacterized SAM-binding protein YcdF (DUF218 family)